jgi:hypothetical protein|tara:strand:- start:813 stop:1274 length:462 start_codon:yes stop_codon:yes gene_type:complete
MGHNNRKFDVYSYMENDARAKEAIVSYLTANKFTDIEAKEDYYFDVSAKKDKDYFFEVEIKNQWYTNWNPNWKEVRIPERKRRLIDKKNKEYPDHDLYFVVFNTDCSQAWFIKDDAVDKSTVGTIQNSRRVGEPHLKEPFFHIPTEEAKLITL